MGASCPTCGARWDFVSDAPWGIGRVRAIHPPSPCRPKPQPQHIDSDLPTCAACGTPFDRQGTSRKTCSDRCREQLRRHQLRAACRRYHQRQRKAS